MADQVHPVGLMESMGLHLGYHETEGVSVRTSWKGRGLAVTRKWQRESESVARSRSSKTARIPWEGKQGEPEM